MHETSKTNALRGREFLARYFSGTVIDIGAGNDLVVPHAESFDRIHGDAEHVLDYRKAGSYDCVHSSHCLEHITNVLPALEQWWELVKPSGYLVLVVPDEDLYEQGIFPSVFNPDHKATFRIDKDHTWSPRSFDVRSLAQALRDAEIISLELQDRDYDYVLKRHGARAWVKLLMKLSNRFQWWVKRAGGNADLLRIISDALLSRLGAPVDQTRRGALAQIQAVLRRRSNDATE